MKIRDEVHDFRGLAEGELEERLVSTEEEVMNLRFRHASGQLEQTAQLRTLRRRIARMKTLLGEKQTADQSDSPAEQV